MCTHTLSMNMPHTISRHTCAYADAQRHARTETHRHGTCMHTYRLALRHADTHTCAPRHPDPALLRQWPLLPQDQPKDIQPLQVEYYPPNGTFSLHYFPYYGNKAHVGASSPPTTATGSSQIQQRLAKGKP